MAVSRHDSTAVFTSNSASCAATSLHTSHSVISNCRMPHLRSQRRGARATGLRRRRDVHGDARRAVCTTFRASTAIMLAGKAKTSGTVAPICAIGSDAKTAWLSAAPGASGTAKLSAADLHRQKPASLEQPHAG